MDHQAFQKIRRHLYRGELAVALTLMETLLEPLRNGQLNERHAKINHDYQLIIDYMGKGVEDPQRDELYARLLRKADALVYNIETHIATRDLRHFADALARVNNSRLNLEQIKTDLEQFVANVALLDLEPEEKREETARQLYRNHHELVATVFDAIWISEAWGNDDEQFCTELILSPTVDANDALLLTSAVTLSLFFHFDFRKSSTLYHIFQQAGDTALRQRALVGWALTLPQNSHLYPQLQDMTNTLCEDTDTASQLIELQMQVYYCMNAENDHAEIQRDIMPNLLKNSHLEITRLGVEEKEDDPLEDILHPDAAEQAMEEVEQSMQKMMNMQKSGADIYFGGFSQMKRYPFFLRVSNWFEPFDLHHPDIQDSLQKLKGSQLMQNLFENGPFCDSDKYSFALAMKSVIDRIPMHMREMLNSDEALGAVAAPEEMNNAMYKRRMYLQDLYRFFRLSDARMGMKNPFATPEESDANDTGELFLANKLFRHSAITGQLVTLCAFFAKRRLFTPLERMLDAFPDADDVRLTYYKGYVAMKKHDYLHAIAIFRQILEQQPEHQKALQGYAKASYLTGDYDTAKDAYGQLLAIAPDHLATQKKYCICLINTGDTDEAVKRLYQIDFEQPGNWDVVRILAWALLVGGKQRQAQAEYKRLLASEGKKHEDEFNAALCVWAGGELSDAIPLLRSYFNHKGVDKNVLAELLKEKEMLSSYGISVYQIIMMADVIKG